MEEKKLSRVQRLNYCWLNIAIHTHVHLLNIRHLTDFV